MYHHLLVPLDGSELSVETTIKAVTLARTLGARVTFFHARPDYGATGEGALERTLSPQAFAERAAGDSRAILAKAEADARAAGVEHESLSKISDRPYEAIIEAAEEQGCDLVVMASHGRRGIRSLMLGSQTQKVLAHANIPVLVSTVESNVPAPQMNSAIAIIKDEHRSIAAVIHGLEFLIREARANRRLLDGRLLRAMLYYIKFFPEALHHPKEEEYVFRKLRERTREMDDVIAELQAQHERDRELVADLERAFAGYEAGAEEGLEALAQTVDRFAEAVWTHMSLEEKVILPAARRYFAELDWVEIAKVFSENGDPRFNTEKDGDFHKLFAQIMNLAPASIGRRGQKVNS